MTNKIPITKANSMTLLPPMTGSMNAHRGRSLNIELMNNETPTTGNEACSMTLTPEEWRMLHRIKTAARLSLGLVWVWEGLVPKVLFPSEMQVEMVRRSGWWWGSPADTLYWLGIAMIPAGLAIMSGIWERAAALVSTVSVLVLMVLVITSNPAALHDPFGGLVKDACLFTCAALVWWWPRR